MEKVQETITSSGRIWKDEELPSTKTWGLADKRTRKSAVSKRQASFTGKRRRVMQPVGVMLLRKGAAEAPAVVGLTLERS